jgi:tetratricopeptide (TPR) repeat protein
MKIPATFLRLALLGALSAAISVTAAVETNVEPAQAAAGTAPSNLPAPVIYPEMDELREQLRVMQRSNEEMKRSSEQASQKWDEMLQQNLALSNVLTGLQQTLITQNDREIKMAQESNSLYIKIITGAAVAVFLVFLFSYWFQLRCLNRVMELSHSLPAPHTAHHHEPALLEQGNPATSKLLAAMKLLEQRLEQLEEPPSFRPAAHANGEYAEVTSAHASTTLLNPAPVESVPPSNVSLLLAKGQTLLDADRLQEAVGCFQEVVAVDPGNAEAHLKKGIALERMNRLDLALSSYEEALRLNPKRTVANVYKARVLAALHRYDEALSVYDSALGKKSGNTETPIFVS